MIRFQADVKKELTKSTSTSASTAKPSTTGGKKLYLVQIGAYSVKKNADKQLKKAKKSAGIKDAFVEV